MSAPQSFLRLLNLTFIPKEFSKSELQLIEAEVAICLINELSVLFDLSYEVSFASSDLKGGNMLDFNILRKMLHEILLNEEYTLDAIVRYTGFHEDAIHEVAAGLNTNPSFFLFYRLVELHRLARRDLYAGVREKICQRLFGNEYAKNDSRSIMSA
jgi:hypothetical protein